MPKNSCYNDVKIEYPLDTRLVAVDVSDDSERVIELGAYEPLEVQSIQQGAGEDGSVLWDAYLGRSLCIFGMPGNFTLVKDND